jgi:asparagine synthase (glutamine-hydrolysing)
MCGISGLIDFSQNSSQEVLMKMTNALTHRGPEAFGYELFNTKNCIVGLGHRRLSIIDLSDTGKQPMRYEHLWITFNGEVYNYTEIKKELQALGHHFIGHSDTEVILHAFAQWGIKCIDKFIGMFVFVIYDTNSQQLFCVRDRAGVKPFFYYWNEGLFLFASELKSFHQHPHFKKELDKDAVASFMQHGHVPTPHCIFKHCYKLNPGHYLQFSLLNSTFTLHKYWDVYDAYNKPKLDISFTEAKKETETILSSAFNYRMVSDVPVGVFLSGGYDSTCVTALLQKDKTEKLKTFTIAFPDIGLNEAPYAKAIAEHIGTEHYEYECTQTEALDLIKELPYCYDEPFADSSAIPTLLVCKMARQQVTVALSADAGDEVFAGYNRYEYVLKHGKKIQQTPHVIRKAVLKLMNTVPANKIPVLKNTYNFHNRYEKLKRLISNPSPQQMMLSMSKQYDSKQLAQLLNYSSTPLKTAYTNTLLKPEYYSPLSFMTAVDYTTYLLDDILQKVDRASMWVSIEGREPFLDHRVIEWAAQLPDEYKYYNGIKKYILKEIVHQYIPKNMMDRPKTGFAIPIEDWLSNDLKEQVLYYLDDKKLEMQNIFETESRMLK